MSTKHAKAAAGFLENKKQAAWYDETLWLVRAKRDKQSKEVPEWEELREMACETKLYSNSHLDELLVEFETNARANGAHVYWAKDADEYCNIVYNILHQHGVKHFIKSKSMLAEECELNPFLEHKGIEVVESDLGERILQLMHLKPSHIVLPAIHVKREQVGELFEKELGTEKGNSDPTYFTGMLGGNVPTLISYSLISNMAVAILSPIIFSFMGIHADISFLDSFLTICSKVLPLLILPLGVAILLRQCLPKIHTVLNKRQSLSFYMWAVSLFLVVGKAVTFIIGQGREAIPLEIAIALLSLIVCIGQFYIGRKLGGRYGDKISGAQGLGQKNTVLAIWLALTYLSPITSIGPASYIIWQNSINSYQLYLKEKQTMKGS